MTVGIAKWSRRFSFFLLLPHVFLLSQFNLIWAECHGKGHWSLNGLKGNECISGERVSWHKVALSTLESYMKIWGVLSMVQCSNIRKEQFRGSICCDRLWWLGMGFGVREIKKGRWGFCLDNLLLQDWVFCGEGSWMYLLFSVSLPCISTCPFSFSLIYCL